MPHKIEICKYDTDISIIIGYPMNVEMNNACKIALNGSNCTLKIMQPIILTIGKNYNNEI